MKIYKSDRTTNFEMRFSQKKKTETYYYLFNCQIQIANFEFVISNTRKDLSKKKIYI